MNAAAAIVFAGNLMALFGVSALSAAESPVPLSPSILTRGPYVQLTTQTNAILRWRTDSPVGSWVHLGLDPDNLDRLESDPDPITDHVITLNRLNPGTRYYYEIRDDFGWLAGGSDFYVTTAPASPKPTRIWAIGDSGTASAGWFGSWLVRDAYYNYTGTRPTDVWLMLGDNAYYSGTDSEYQAAVFDTYPTLLRNTAVWSTLGNHETYSPFPNSPISYFDIFSLPKRGEAGGIPSGTENYYSFNYGNVHFVCIDSELSTREPGSPMLTWLEADLEANTNDWVIAFWHSPPYTKGSHDSDNLFDNGGNMTQMRQYVNPILESYGVDLVLCGHSHNYERSLLLKGHYGFSWELVPDMILDRGDGQPDGTGAYLKPESGPAANEGTIYVVNGSSGWATSKTGFHPVMHVAHLNMGSLVIDIDGRRLDARYLRETGAIDDQFTIIKNGSTPAPLRFTTIRVVDGIVTAKWKTVAGYSYRVEKKSNLTGADWEPASEMILATGATTFWEGQVLPGEDECYYRVSLVD